MEQSKLNEILEKHRKWLMNEKVKQALENIDLGSNTLESQTKQFQEDYNLVVNALNDYEEEKKELIAEQHRLFDLAKEQEQEIEELKEFVDIMARHTKTGGGKYISIHIVCDEGEPDYLILKKVVENYGTK